MERKCGNCKNIKHTGRFINGAGVYTCDVIRGEVDILSLCNFFTPIETFREGAPEIKSPGSAGFRGYELLEKSTIKVTNGYLIWLTL